MSYLIHYGIKGQKWGIRNYQNPDGTLTEEGRMRYGQSHEFSISNDDKNRAKHILENIIKNNTDGDPELEELELMDLITSKSVDYYNSIGVSQSNKKEIARHNKSIKNIENKINDKEKNIKLKCNFPKEDDPNADQKFAKAVDKFLKLSNKDSELKSLNRSLYDEQTRYKNNLVKNVLNDFGIPVTKQNIEAIYYSVIVD